MQDTRYKNILLILQKANKGKRESDINHIDISKT